MAEKLKQQLKEQNPDLPEEALDVDIPNPKNNPHRQVPQHMVMPQGIQYHQLANWGIPVNAHDPQYGAVVQAQMQRQEIQLHEQGRYVGWQRPQDLRLPPVLHAPLAPPRERQRRRK